VVDCISKQVLEKLTESSRVGHNLLIIDNIDRRVRCFDSLPAGRYRLRERALDWVVNGLALTSEGEQITDQALRPTERCLRVVKM
jgi:hypothetical protein